VDLAERIRVKRKARQISQEELARRVGMSLRALSSLERGESVDPHISTLSRIADGLDVSVGELLDSPKVQAPTSYTSPEGADEDRRKAEEELLQIEIEKEVERGREAGERIRRRMEAEGEILSVDDDDRREDLRKSREILREAREMLESLANTYESTGDREKFRILTSIAILSGLGAKQFAEVEVGESQDREGGRVYTAVALLDELAQDLIDRLDADVVDLGAFAAHKRVG
jgi:transcriptional regulator with XRE-family HTH domain